MLRLILFIIITIILAGAAVWLKQHDGLMTIQWLGYHIEISASITAALLLASTIVLFFLIRGFLWLWNLPHRLSDARKESRNRKGHELIVQGFTAVAAGDVDAARKLTRKAHNLLGSPPLTLLLAAQTAQLEGNEERASDYYRAMLAHKDCEFLGLRGLLVKHPSHSGEAMEEALKLAERAYELRPNTGWVVQLLIEYYIRLGRWQEAEQIIRRAKKQQTLSQQEAAHKIAITHYEQALRNKEAGNEDAALEHIRKSIKATPDFPPSTLLATELYLHNGQPKKAMKVLEEAIKQTPHPEVAATWLEEVRALSETEQLKRWEKLTRNATTSLTGQLISAKLAMQAGQWGKARNFLKGALNICETVTVCKLMAQLEESEPISSATQDPSSQEEEQTRRKQRAQEWRIRQAEALTDPHWMCSHCHSPSQKWNITCPSCGTFDTLEWDTSNQQKDSPKNALKQSLLPSPIPEDIQTI